MQVRHHLRNFSIKLVKEKKKWISEFNLIKIMYLCTYIVGKSYRCIQRYDHYSRHLGYKWTSSRRKEGGKIHSSSHGYV